LTITLAACGSDTGLTATNPTPSTAGAATSGPDSSSPDYTSPDYTSPDYTSSDSSSSDSSSPDNSSPDNSSPDNSSSGSSSPDTSSPDSEAPDTSDRTTDAPTTTAAPAPLPADAEPAGACAFTAPAAMGEITWVRNGQLQALADGGQPICLLDGATTEAAVIPVAWSSDASRALIDPSRVGDAKGFHETRFDPSDPAVSLSGPSAQAAISVDPVNRRLLWHSLSTGEERDISFLATTDLAVYHPSGKRIVAVGTNAFGMYGIWLATNRGENPILITSIDDPAVPATNLSFSADGTTLFFVHGFVHGLFVPTLELGEYGTADRHEDHLTVSKIDNARAWTFGPCDSTGSVVMSTNLLPDVVDVRTIEGSPFAGTATTLQPIGWLSGYRLVLAARESGCAGPADVWIWSPVDGFVHVGHDLVAPSVRIPRGPFMDLPETIEQAAPG
jgi:hypothetical protein